MWIHVGYYLACICAEHPALPFFQEANQRKRMNTKYNHFYEIKSWNKSASADNSLWPCGMFLDKRPELKGESWPPRFVSKGGYLNHLLRLNHCTYYLVVEPTHLYARQIGSWNPNFQGKNKNTWNHHLELNHLRPHFEVSTCAELRGYISSPWCSWPLTPCQ